MKIINKNAKRDFSLLDTFEAGIVLSGGEVKSIRQGRMNLHGTYVRFLSDKLYLVGAQIHAYQFSNDSEYDDKRTRALLLHKSELLRLRNRLSERPNLTIIPISCYTKGRHIKLEIALAQGKKTWEIKKIEKNKDENRRISKELKEKYRG